MKLIRAICGHRVNRIREHNDSGAERNVGSGELVGIAGSIPVLVMMPNRGEDIFELTHFLRELDTLERVQFHDCTFIGRQLARLLENRLKDLMNLPYIMKQRGNRDAVNLTLWQTHRVGDDCCIA